MQVMSDGLLRISEAVAVDCAHISVETDGTGRLLIPNSKTDQTGQGAVVFLSKTTMNPLMPIASSPALSPGHCFARLVAAIISPRIV